MRRTKNSVSKTCRCDVTAPYVLQECQNDARFDVVVSAKTLEVACLDVPNYENAVWKIAHQMLKPGGWFIQCGYIGSTGYYVGECYRGEVLLLLLIGLFIKRKRIHFVNHKTKLRFNTTMRLYFQVSITSPGNKRLRSIHMDNLHNNQCYVQYLMNSPQKKIYIQFISVSAFRIVFFTRTNSLRAKHHEAVSSAVSKCRLSSYSHLFREVNKKRQSPPASLASSSL